MYCWPLPTTSGLPKAEAHTPQVTDIKKTGGCFRHYHGSTCAAPTQKSESSLHRGHHSAAPGCKPESDQLCAAAHVGGRWLQRCQRQVGDQPVSVSRSGLQGVCADTAAQCHQPAYSVHSYHYWWWAVLSLLSSLSLTPPPPLSLSHSLFVSPTRLCMRFQAYVYIFCVYHIVYVDMCTRSSQINHLTLCLSLSCSLSLVYVQWNPDKFTKDHPDERPLLF